MSERKPKIKENGTLAGCIGTDKPIEPNKCEECPKHSDFSCKDVKVVKKEK